MDNKKVKKKPQKHTSNDERHECQSSSSETSEASPQLNTTVKSIDEIISAFIEGKDEASEAIMNKCSDEAHDIRDKINGVLESREMLLSDGDSTDDRNKNDVINFQRQLETNIREKIADLQGALRDACKNDNKNDNNGVQNKNNDICSDNCNDNHNQHNDEREKCENINSEKCKNDSEKCDANCKTKAEVNTYECPLSANEVNAKDDKTNKKSKSLNKKVEHKEKLTAEQFSKKLAAFESDSERINYLSTRYMEMAQENRKLNQNLKLSDRIANQLRKEKDQMQAEHNRVVLTKCRLESLCRELQRQNKAIKDESLLKIKEEEEKRKEIVSKFQSTLNDIMQLIQENQRRNAQLKDENADLAQKLKVLMGHYENWEKHTEQIIKQKELESQLLKAKYAKSNLVFNQEKEIFIKEKEQLIIMVTELQKRCSDLSGSELHLRAELNIYTTKYEEFQNVLSKSNETFSGFKKDIEKMSKQIKKLEKETAQWKSKWESSNRALLVLTEEKQKRDSDLLEALQKIHTLEKLCRALQDERSQMQTQLKQYTDVTQNELIDN